MELYQFGILAILIGIFYVIRLFYITGRDSKPMYIVHKPLFAKRTPTDDLFNPKKLRTNSKKHRVIKY